MLSWANLRKFATMLSHCLKTNYNIYCLPANMLHPYIIEGVKLGYKVVYCVICNVGVVHI